MSDRVFYATTPIYYVNDVPHLGHAYTTIAADMICRFRRLQGRRVHLLTGTDEHGQKVMRTAQEKGVSPQQWADQIVPRWKEIWTHLQIANDDFIRTTEPRHVKPVQRFVQSLYDRDQIYLGRYEGLYCVRCEAFKAPDELVDGKCPLHAIEPEAVEEENYFFRLSDFADRLVELYQDDERFVMPEVRRNEVLGKVKLGLEDLSISRVSFDWGIPLPWDPKHVIYVWVDALQNYITAIGYGADESRFNEVWPVDVHFIGKDILWFHSVIWPAMLMALDLPLPRTVFAHGFIQVGGEKMSKSRLTGISPRDLTETFGVDGYRYYFLREISFGQDGEFSWEAMMHRYNSDLANDLGNLVSRVLSMVTRYLEGKIPAPPSHDELDEADRRLMTTFTDSLSAMSDAVDAIAPHDALKSAWRFVRRANAYVEEVTPWALAKDPGSRRRLEVVLYNLIDSLRLIALLTAPVLPLASSELWRRVGMEGDVHDRTFDQDGRFGLVQEGRTVDVGAPLFPRLEDAAGTSK